MCWQAAAQMTAACDRAPNHVLYRIALGVAQYRLARFDPRRYADAHATLSRCDPKQPTALAFLALTQHHLDQPEAAQATLARLRGVMTASRWAKDADAQAFLREATLIIEGRSDPPPP
jgi:hypothetical protein